MMDDRDKAPPQLAAGLCPGASVRVSPYGRAPGGADVGRIISSVRIESLADPAQSLRCDAMVDTGATYMTLPMAWRERLGDLNELEVVALRTATQEAVAATVCGPVRIQIEGFRTIYNEVCFVEMEPDGGSYTPLIGYIPLEQSGAAVDMLGHRLIHVRYMDLR
jgi:predicted aspartyl protease